MAFILSACGDSNPSSDESSFPNITKVNPPIDAKAASSAEISKLFNNAKIEDQLAKGLYLDQSSTLTTTVAGTDELADGSTLGISFACTTQLNMRIISLGSLADEDDADLFHFYFYVDVTTIGSGYAYNSKTHKRTCNNDTVNNHVTVYKQDYYTADKNQLPYSLINYYNANIDSNYDYVFSKYINDRTFSLYTSNTSNWSSGDGGLVKEEISKRFTFQKPNLYPIFGGLQSFTSSTLSTLLSKSNYVLETKSYIDSKTTGTGRMYDLSSIESNLKDVKLCNYAPTVPECDSYLSDNCQTCAEHTDLSNLLER